MYIDLDISSEQIHIAKIQESKQDGFVVFVSFESVLNSFEPYTVLTQHIHLVITITSLLSSLWSFRTCQPGWSRLCLAFSTWGSGAALSKLQAEAKLLMFLKSKYSFWKGLSLREIQIVLHRGAESFQSFGKEQWTWFHVCFEFLVSNIKKICRTEELSTPMQGKNSVP